MNISNFTIQRLRFSIFKVKHKFLIDTTWKLDNLALTTNKISKLNKIIEVKTLLNFYKIKDPLP